MVKISRVFFASTALLLVGCEGCGNSPRQRGDDTVSSERAFSSNRPKVFPVGELRVTGAVKPGHWVTASCELKSNTANSRGELRSRFESISETDAIPDTLLGYGSDRVLPSSRPAVLPRGQERRFDFRLLMPQPRLTNASRFSLVSRYGSAAEGVSHRVSSTPLVLMSAEEYFFVVLTRRPQRLSRLRNSNWVDRARTATGFSAGGGNYRIIAPSAKSGVMQLSETMLDWTSTAVLWWDDLPADALTPAQQTAIHDWVSFGGTLVVNGPDAAEAIGRSRLSQILPMRPTANVELDSAAAGELLKTWSAQSDRSTEKQIAVLRSASSRVAVEGLRAFDASAVTGTGDLILVRRQGRGRVVQARFDLTQDWLSAWRSYDSFINGVILRRPRREFRQSAEVTAEGETLKTYPDLPSRAIDATVNSRLRITARDAVLPIDPTNQVSRPDPSVESNAPTTTANEEGTRRFDKLALSDAISGVGGWTDESSLMQICRQILATESAIEVPDTSLVFKSLGIYLVALIPLNFLFFRILGRLELAWLAVPVIALVGTIAISRAVRLDIGFARSQTEIAVLEMQPEYPRGHLTRAVTIYNSLSNEYEIQFDSPDAAVAPIRGRRRRGETSAETFRNAFGKGPALSGFAVESNSTEDSSFHAEQVVDVGGGIRLSGRQVVNSSDLEIEDAFLVEKNSAGEIRIAVIGALPPGRRAPVNFDENSRVRIATPLPLQAEGLIDRLASGSAMHRNTIRLLGRVDGALPGMAVQPTAERVIAQTVVLVHLKHREIESPKKDANLPIDTVSVRTDL